jgi:hypothetical protein
MIKHAEQAIEHRVGGCTTGNWHPQPFEKLFHVRP